jgi:hypothetical protein
VSGIPEGQPKYNDLIDIVIQAAQKTIDVEQKDGTFTKEQVMDEEIVWWKTGSVNSNTFARFAYELKEFERMGIEAFEYMSPDRARAFALQIQSVATSYRRSIDAKSSESQRDKENSQSTLIDKINRNKIEKVYTSKTDQAKAGLASIFMGKDKDKDMDDD